MFLLSQVAPALPLSDHIGCPIQELVESEASVWPRSSQLVADNSLDRAVLNDVRVPAAISVIVFEVSPRARPADQRD